MRDRYQKIAAKLDQLIWDELWEGFRPYSFALYDQETVYLSEGEIPWDDRFLANTAIEFDGERMAIWNMAFADPDDDQMAANLAHEMFHCFQMEQGESRYPDDLALMAYPPDEQNFQMKFAENRLLAEAVGEVDLIRKKALLGQFVQLRRERAERLGDYFNQEILVETLEGSAEYVGMNALKQLDEGKFQLKLQEYQSYLSKLSPMLFNIRRISYYTGTLYLLALNELGVPIPADLTNTAPLFKLTTEQFPGTSLAWLPQANLEELLQQEVKRKETVIAEFLATNPLEVQQKSRISGYDPMNTFRQDQWLYCTNFINLTSVESGAKEFLRGPILLRLAEGSNREVESYYWNES